MNRGARRLRPARRASARRLVDDHARHRRQPGGNRAPVRTAFPPSTDLSESDFPGQDANLGKPAATCLDDTVFLPAAQSPKPAQRVRRATLSPNSVAAGLARRTSRTTGSASTYVTATLSCSRRACRCRRFRLLRKWSSALSSRRFRRLRRPHGRSCVRSTSSLLPQVGLNSSVRRSKSDPSSSPCFSGEAINAALTRARSRGVAREAMTWRRRCCFASFKSVRCRADGRFDAVSPTAACPSRPRPERRRWRRSPPRTRGSHGAGFGRARASSRTPHPA